jgi:hypothetical protein
MHLCTCMNERLEYATENHYGKSHLQYATGNHINDCSECKIVPRDSFSSKKSNDKIVPDGILKKCCRVNQAPHGIISPRILAGFSEQFPVPTSQKICDE